MSSYSHLVNHVSLDELHLTPLHDIIQLRPSLCHLEFGDALSQRSFYVGGSASDGDTTATESESEEAKPVTVRYKSCLAIICYICVTSGKICSSKYENKS